MNQSKVAICLFKSDVNELNREYSRLLLQTAVSAQLLVEDQPLKDLINEISDEKFGGNRLLDFGPYSKRSDITYCILLLTRRAGQVADILPFFSLVSFYLMIRKIRLLGFNIQIGKA